MALTSNTTDQALLNAELHLWTNTFSYSKSIALKSAIDLRLADAIQRHGGAATLSQIVAEVTVHPSKTSCLRRLMRVLTVAGIFSIQRPDGDGTGSGEPLYTLTPASRLLFGSQKLSPITAMVLSPALITPFLELGTWFQRELPGPCVFKHTHGESLWERAGRDATLDALVNDALACDSRFIVDFAIRESGEVFQGIGSLVDVGGGLGAASQAISKAFPSLECSVLDLGHVVANAPTDTAVKYITGDMFESIPPANAVFLKSVLHDWGDEDCVKILRNCRNAIPPREAGGKVIIIDVVVGAGPADAKREEMQVSFDLYIMIVNGIERDEQEWEKIFLEAGFSGYKIVSILGFRSIIEVYP